jgi:hypothetical protein
VITTSSTHVAQTLDLAIGDFDDDGLNEIMAAGVAGMMNGNPVCNVGGNVRYVAVMYEFDGRSVGKTSMAASTAADVLSATDCPDSELMMRFAFVNAVDLDGDLDHEFHVNQYVFSAFPAQNATWATAALAVLDPMALFPQGSRLVFDRHSAVIQSGDVNGDGRGDLVSFRAGVPELTVYSATLDGFYRSARIPIETLGLYASTPRAMNPQLVPFSGDLANEGDIVVLQFAGHFLDFTEPLVIAALAAPPCMEEVGQNIDACTTTWGRSESVSVEGERELKFKAGVSVGLKYEQAVPIIGVAVGEFVIKGTLERETAKIKNESYDVTKTISFETGPLEDSVVFTSIPYDVYRFIEVAASTRNDAVAVYDISLPREAVIRLATAKYYNAHTPASSLKIDDSVFTHRVGEIESYPTPLERDLLLGERRTQVQALRTDCPYCWQAKTDTTLPLFDLGLRRFDPFEALPGLKSKLVGVGQGSGATEVGVELNAANGVGRSLETAAEVEVEWMTAGVIGGFQIGFGAATSTTITHSEGSSYVGTIGSIDAAHFIANKYRFGLFTYLQVDPGSGFEFEVINYWVEQD